MENKEYEKMNELERSCFRFFRDRNGEAWSGLEYAIKRFSALSEKRIRELAELADPEGYNKKVIVNYGGQFLYPFSENACGRWSYKCMKHAIRIYNPRGILVACLVNGIQSSATEIEPGRIWYSYGDVEGLDFEFYSDQLRAVREAFEALGYKAVQRGFMDWIYTREIA